MNEQHLHTVTRQARAFLDAREPAEALRLLEQARMLARDDVAALADVHLLQARAAAMAGRGDDAVGYARQALSLDPGMAAHLEPIARECESIGRDEAADALRALGAAPEQRRPARRGLRGVQLAGGLLVIAIAIGALLYFDVIPAGRAGRVVASERLDFQRVKDNVGLVIVTAKYTFINGRSVTIPVGSGSCFAVSADGHLLTNQHVTAARNEIPDVLNDDRGRLEAKQEWWKIKVCFGPDDKQHYDAKIVYESPYRDVALLKIEKREFPTYLRVAEGWGPGDDVFAAGFPGAVSDALAEKGMTEIIRRRATEFGKRDADVSTLSITESGYDVTITRGVISAVRKIDGQVHVQTDAVVTPGNSGGPLLTRDCAVVGINSWAAVQSEAYNFALSLDEVRAELQPFVNVR